MFRTDDFGPALTGSDAAAIARYDSALGKLLLLRNDPVAEVDAATAIDPGLVMGHVLKGLLCVLGTEKALLPEARAALALARAAADGATAREQGHIAALAAWIDGRFHDAGACWEQVLVAQPDDVLAMFAAHQGDFFLGQSSELRDRVARRLPDIARGGALEGHYLGMWAFGLEEMGDYRAAESAARQALACEPRNAWATHALVHVMEMTHRVDEGIDFLTSTAPQWADDSFFAVHNWWHLALYHADRQQWPQVLGVYDQHIRGSDSAVVLDMIDASALLWRLMLQGVDVGDRWQGLVEVWEPQIDRAWYVFNDCHAMMAFVGAGRDDLAQRLIAVLERGAQQPGDNAANTRAVGLPLARALQLYGQRQYLAAMQLLMPIRSIAARVGGSHAQRDLIAQTLIAAAERAKQGAVARALLNERLMLKPGSMLNQAWVARVQSKPLH